MARRILFGTVAVAAAAAATLAQAAPVYVALGDSITFGEGNLSYFQSNGDRGYVGSFADILAGRTGTRPIIANLAIDGETTSSFFTNAGRVPPVVERGDSPLQLENTNYNNSNVISQDTLFRNTVAAQTAAGNTISTVSVTLGFNDLAALLPAQPSPAGEAAAIAAIPAELATYKSNFTNVLTDVRAQAPNADLYVLGYFNPFPADPTSPAGPLFAAGGTSLNSIIQSLATQFNATYVNNATPFVGHEAQYTFEAAQPTNSVVTGPFGGSLPIGNVHPNPLGYSVIAGDIAATAVPEPSSWLMLATAAGAFGLMLRRRGARSAAAA